MNEAFPAVFARLREILRAHAGALVVMKDRDDAYYLDTKTVGPNRKPVFFGAIETKKNYVSFHLFPVYVNPKLLDDLSPDLKKRMQGKACFQFKAIDEGLFAELDALTRRGFAEFRDRGFA